MNTTDNETKQSADPAVEPAAAQPSAPQEPSPEAREWKDKYIRLYAEFENYKKRISREQLIWEHIAHKDIILHVLPILDDLERGVCSLEEAEQDCKETQKGIELIQSNLYKALTRKGLQVMEVNIGDEFDPQRHEALTKAPTEDPQLKDKIVTIVTKGYLLHDKVIRPAQVIIGT